MSSEEITTTAFDPVTDPAVVNASTSILLRYLDYFQSDKTMVPCIIWLVLIAIVSLVGNPQVLFVYIRKVKVTPTKFLMMSLACVDLVTTLVALAEIVAMLDVLDNHDNEVYFCQARFFFINLTTTLSVMLLIILAVVRYRKDCHPYGWQMNIKDTKRVCLSTALMTVSFAVPTLFLPCCHVRGSHSPGSYCSVLVIDYTYLPLLTVSTLCCVPLIILYVGIWRTANQQNTPPGAKLISSSSTAEREELRPPKPTDHTTGELSMSSTISTRKELHRHDLTAGCTQALSYQPINDGGDDLSQVSAIPKNEELIRPVLTEFDENKERENIDDVECGMRRQKNKYDYYLELYDMTTDNDQAASAMLVESAEDGVVRGKRRDVVTIEINEQKKGQGQRAGRILLLGTAKAETEIETHKEIKGGTKDDFHVSDDVLAENEATKESRVSQKRRLLTTHKTGVLENSDIVTFHNKIGEEEDIEIQHDSIQQINQVKINNRVTAESPNVLISTRSSPTDDKGGNSCLPKITGNGKKNVGQIANSSDQRTVLKRQSEKSKMFAIISVIHMFSYLLSYSLSLFQFSSPDNEVSPYFYILFVRFYFINTAVTPLVYAIYDVTLRDYCETGANAVKWAICNLFGGVCKCIECLTD